MLNYPSLACRLLFPLVVASMVFLAQLLLVSALHKSAPLLPNISISTLFLNIERHQPTHNLVVASTSLFLPALPPRLLFSTPFVNVVTSITFVGIYDLMTSHTNAYLI